MAALYGQTYLVEEQVLQGLGIVPEGAPSPLTSQSLDGTEFTLMINASNETRTSLLSSATGFIPDYLSNSSENYRFTYSGLTRLLYFKYNVCENDPSNPIPGVCRDRVEHDRFESDRNSCNRFSREHCRRQRRHQSVL
jgi:hypothetical protein